MREIGAKVRVTVWFWVLAVLALMWNAIGALDYTMTKLHVAAYLKGAPSGMLAKIDAFPGWATAAWAVGVWGSLLGAVLLLLRSRWALPAYLASLAGLAVNTWYQHLAGIPTASALAAAIWVILLALIVWCWRLRASGRAALRVYPRARDFWRIRRA